MHDFRSWGIDDVSSEGRMAARGMGDAPTREPWLIAGTFFLAVSCAVVAFWPEPPDPNMLAADEMAAIYADEQLAGVVFQNVWRELGNGADPGQVADRIDRDVLPVWRRGRARVDRACMGPLADRFPRKLPEFFRKREIAWVIMAEALRSNDPVEAQESREAWQAANDLADEILAEKTRIAQRSASR